MVKPKAQDLEQVNDEPEGESTVDESFQIGQRKSPPLFPQYEDKENINLLENSFKKGILWAISKGYLSSLENKSLGSWTIFNKSITQDNKAKSIMEYLPTIATTDYPVCKYFLDKLLQIMKDLDLRFIFAHSDEQVYGKLAHILRKFPDLHKNIVIVMGGFHQLIIFKRYVCKGFRKWFIDAGIIAEGSADIVLEGRHYCRNMRLFKERFSASVQYRVENFTNNLRWKILATKPQSMK